LNELLLFRFPCSQRARKTRAAAGPILAAVPLPKNLLGNFENGPISTVIDAALAWCDRRQTFALSLESLLNPRIKIGAAVSPEFLSRFEMARPFAL
jgi:hypothetical protein